MARHIIHMNAGYAAPRLRQRLQQQRRRAVQAAKLHRDLGERLVETAAAQAEGIGLAQLRATTRQIKRVAEARQLGMYLAHTLFSASLTRTGRLFGRDRTTARHACARVEDARDERRMALRLAHLEPAMQRWAERFALVILGAQDEEPEA